MSRLRTLSLFTILGIVTAVAIVYLWVTGQEVPDVLLVLGGYLLGYQRLRADAAPAVGEPMRAVYIPGEAA